MRIAFVMGRQGIRDGRHQLEPLIADGLCFPSGELRHAEFTRAYKNSGPNGPACLAV